MKSQRRTRSLRFGLVVGCLWTWSLAFGLPPVGAEVLPLAKSLRADAAYGRLPLYFERNVGQADAAVRFLARGRGYTVSLAGTEAILSLRPGGGVEPSKSVRADRAQAVGKRETPVQGGPVVVRLQLLGANPSAPAVAEDPLPTKVNYFRGNDPAKWRTGISTSTKVRYAGIYPGIDLVYYGIQGQLEHDFVLAPGADPAAIRLRVQGADALTIDPAGDLVLQLPAGAVRLHRPVLYQEHAGSRTPIPGGYRQTGPTEVAFTVGPYNPDRPLVIDPVLSYSTYLGGNGEDHVTGIAVDGSGAAYVTGYTNSTDFPTTAGALDTSLSGTSDAFVAKLTPDGTALVYATYLGGSGEDSASGIAVDAAGAAYVAGYTTSADFPVTPGALDTTINAYSDAFVAKLTPDGTALAYATYLGYGSSSAIAVDATGAAYVAGYTNDAFVAKLTPDGTALAYATYFGGSSSEITYAIAVDATGAAYVTGHTYSSDFPTTPGAFATSPRSGGGSEPRDAFVTKLRPDGTALVYSTYLGGNGLDFGYAIAVDAPGAGYVTGYTTSTDFPTTPGAFDTTLSGYDAFVAKLTPDGTALVYATHLGGNSFGNAIAVDATGAAYVTGKISSADFPTTAGAIQSIYSGAIDAFVTMLDPEGKALFYSSFLGGNLGDEGLAVAVATSGDFYVAGKTNSNMIFPITTGAVQPTIGGGTDSFITKFTWAGALPGLVVTATTPTANEAGLTPGTFRFTRAGDVTAPLTVHYTVAGTATPGSDYQALPPSVTIPAGQSTQDLSVIPKDDTEVELAETVILTLTADPAYTLGTPPSATVTILSDERAIVTVTAPNATANENPRVTGTFRITRDGPTADPLTVFYTLGGTATPGTDYMIQLASVTIPAGQSTRDLTVTPLNDDLIEPPETVVLTLTENPSYALGSPSSATVTIISDDPSVTVTALNSTVTEEGPSNVTFRFARTGPTTDSLVVTFTLGGTATAGSDYQTLPTTVTFFQGQSLKDLVLTTIDDLLVETAETVVLTIAASPNYTVGTPGSATVTITSEEKPTVTVIAPNPTASEQGLSAGTFRLTRTGELSASLAVSYTVTGTATSGSDYEPLGTSVTFPAGLATVDVPLTPRDDTLIETPETVVLTLTANAAYTVGSPSSATVSIVDNDLDGSPPTITHTPVTSAAANAPLLITATITDNVGVQTATLYYKTKGAGSYTSAAMTASGSTYRATIPGSAVTAAGVQYYLEAGDAANPVTRAPSTAPGTPYSLIVGATVFTDDPLLPGSTSVKAAHFTELRTAINRIRPFAWNEPAPAPGGTVRAAVLTELRNALNAAYDAAGKTHPSYTDPTITPGVTAIKARHLNELRTHVRGLE